MYGCVVVRCGVLAKCQNYPCRSLRHVFDMTASGLVIYVGPCCSGSILLSTRNMLHGVVDTGVGMRNATRSGETVKWSW